MSSPCDKRGTALAKNIFVHGPVNVLGRPRKITAVDANIQHPKLLDAERPYSFQNELISIIYTWRSLYVEFPWSELAESYNEGDFSVFEKIFELRESANKVKFIRMTKNSNFCMRNILNVFLQTVELQM